MGKYCSKCGKQINDEASFCDGCGNGLDQVPKKEIICPRCGSNKIQRSDKSGLRFLWIATILCFLLAKSALFLILFLIFGIIAFITSIFKIWSAIKNYGNPQKWKMECKTCGNIFMMLEPIGGDVIINNNNDDDDDEKKSLIKRIT